MKVGVDIRELHQGGMTGIGRYLLNILKYLAVHTAGHEYYLYCAADVESEVQSEAFKSRKLRAPCRPWFDHVVLGRAARQDRVDVFFSPFVKAPLNVHCPIVNTVHDLLFLKLKEYDLRRNVLYHRLFQWRGRRVCARAKTVVTVSEHSKKDIVSLWGAAPDKIAVVPNVVGHEFTREADGQRVASARERYGIQGQYVFYVGNFGPHKNVGRLLEAYATLPDSMRKEHSLVLAGRHDRYVDALKEKADSLGLGRSAQFIGYVPDDELPALYTGASLFMFPSLYEGFGLPPLEAMACGAPVVASCTTSLPEVVADAGLLVEPRDVGSIRDAMQRVLSDRSFAEDLGRKSLDRAAMFRPERIIPGFVQVLEDAVGGGD